MSRGTSLDEARNDRASRDFRRCGQIDAPGGRPYHSRSRADPGSDAAGVAATGRAEQGGAWRSLVAHLLWEQRVGGSNPSAPTIRIADSRRP